MANGENRRVFNGNITLGKSLKGWGNYSKTA